MQVENLKEVLKGQQDEKKFKAADDDSKSQSR
jgi:hypothetical protein